MSGPALVVVANYVRGGRVALVDRRLDLLWSAAVHPSDAVIRERDIEAVVTDALAEAARRSLTVEGLAFATPHPEIASGSVEGLGQRFGLRWAVDRLVNALLEGERRLGTIREATNALVLDGDAPAVALQLVGRIHRGAHGLAGDITHFGLDRTGPVRCGCGRYGCLGALLAAGPAAPEPPGPAAFPAAPTRELGWLAVAGITLLNVVNPDLLVVAGASVEDSSHLAWFAEAVRAGCLSATRVGVDTVTRAHGDSVLLGTAALFGADRFTPRADK